MLNADFVSHLYRNTLKLLPFKWLRKSSKITQTFFDIAGILQKSPENHRKSSEVIGTLSTIPVMTRQKSHTCDSEEVGRYITPTLLCTTPFYVSTMFREKKTKNRALLLCYQWVALCNLFLPLGQLTNLSLYTLKNVTLST